MIYYINLNGDKKQSMFSHRYFIALGNNMQKIFLIILDVFIIGEIREIMIYAVFEKSLTPLLNRQIVLIEKFIRRSL